MDKRKHGLLPVMAMILASEGQGLPRPKLPKPKPPGYGVHIPKALRKGKTFEELQAMREGRSSDE